MVVAVKLVILKAFGSLDYCVGSFIAQDKIKWRLKLAKSQSRVLSAFESTIKTRHLLCTGKPPK